MFWSESLFFSDIVLLMGLRQICSWRRMGVSAVAGSRCIKSTELKELDVIFVFDI